ncbi:MAG: DMT family transporter [Patescibacteria group bacterium]
MSWFYLALLAPLIYAVVNLVDDNMLRHVYKSPHIGAIVSGLFGGLPILSLLLWPAAGIAFQYSAISVICGFLLTLFYYFYFVALDKESPSVVVAFIGSAPILIGALAYIFLGERYTSLQIIGLGIILVSSILLVVNKSEKTHFSKSLVPLLGAAVIICIISVLLKYVYERAPFYPVYLWFCAGMVLGGIYLWLVLYYSKQTKTTKSLKKSLRKYFLLFLITEILAITAEFVMSLAISRGPVTVIRSIEGIQPVYILLISLALYPFYPKLFREVSEGKMVLKFILVSCIVGGLYLLKDTIR